MPHWFHFNCLICKFFFYCAFVNLGSKRSMYSITTQQPTSGEFPIINTLSSSQPSRRVFLDLMYRRPARQARISTTATLQEHRHQSVPACGGLSCGVRPALNTLCTQKRHLLQNVFFFFFLGVTVRIYNLAVEPNKVRQ